MDVKDHAKDHAKMIEWLTNREFPTDTMAVVMSNVAVYHLLNERLPEKPMPVIDIPTAPQDSRLVASPISDGGIEFNCTVRPEDSLEVTALKDGDFEFRIPTVEDGLVYLSKADAEVLARAILAAI